MEEYDYQFAQDLSSEHKCSEHKYTTQKVILATSGIAFVLYGIVFGIGFACHEILFQS